MSTNGTAAKNEAAFVAKIAARTAQYYMAIYAACEEHDELGFYEDFEEAMAAMPVGDPFMARWGLAFGDLLNKCLTPDAR